MADKRLEHHTMTFQLLTDENWRNQMVIERDTMKISERKPAKRHKTG